jgi:serine/threonine protein kinase/class 3 adenylate cyclase
MTFGRFRLLTQRGVGRDAVAYRACDPSDDSLYLLYVLNRADTDLERWQYLSKRLRLAAMLNHAGAVRLRELELSGDPAYVALEWLAGAPLADSLADGSSWPMATSITVARSLIQTIAAAHDIGLAHGQLWPSRIGTTTGSGLKLDFTGVDAIAPAESPFDRLCRSPESCDRRVADPAGDMYGLGALLCCLLTGQATRAAECVAARMLPAGTPPPLGQLVRDLLAADPVERPTALEAAARLDELCRAAGTACRSGIEPAEAAAGSVDITGEFGPGGPPATARPDRAGIEPARMRGPDSLAPPPSQAVAQPAMTSDRLGRFQLVEKLGEGGMGAVYRAIDTADGGTVALKLLSPQLAQQPDTLRRFRKEARLLAEVRNPFVTNLLEVNEHAGLHYLVIEYVAGRSVAQLLRGQGKLDEPVALSILADVARALVEPHERGIVHRDIKPDNILLTAAVSRDAPPRVKLSDFGLARHVVESESLHVTRTGAILGTPLYMSPEQCSGQAAVDARSDVYSMGATLFAMLAGRPPFLAESPMAVIGLHLHEPPPRLQKLNPALSDGVCQIIDKALAKHPDHRYADAAALLRDLERLQRGEPTSMVLHPRPRDARGAKVLEYDFTWELASSPRQLWPYVSNTERLNRAIGVAPVSFRAEPDPRGGSERFAQVQAAGLTLQWREHPFEWIEGRRMGVLREFSRGPFQWFISTTELMPRLGGGTTLRHSFRIESRGWLGRLVAAIEIGRKARRALDRVYQRIDAALTGRMTGAAIDPFEEPARPTAAVQRRVEQLLDRLIDRQIEASTTEKLGEFVLRAPPQAAARIRPIALARQLGLDSDQVVAACLHGARAGLFLLLWDLICPICRIPSQIIDTLRALREHGHCEACNADFELDFAQSVELIFRVHPEIRDVELRTYCVGGPAHSPHVVAQVRIDPGERVELELSLDEGAYRLRGPQLPFAIPLRVRAGSGVGRWELNLARAPDRDAVPTLKAGAQVIALCNDHAAELLVRIERTAARDDALTAARACSLALFRELFPGEILAPGQLIDVATVTLLVSELDAGGDLYGALGDAAAFAVVHEYFRIVGEQVKQAGGAMVKTVGERMLAVFNNTAAAVRAGLELSPALAGAAGTRPFGVRSAVHRGETRAVTLNDRLDYFGSTVSAAWQLPERARPGELLLSAAVATDPQVAALLAERELKLDVLEMAAALPGGLVHRVCAAERDGKPIPT